MTRGFGYNWRQSSAHVWFLTTFLKPRQPDNHYLGVDWTLALAEPPGKAIERFLAQGVLTRAPLQVRLETQFTRDQLKQMLRDHEPPLPISGNKDELITRLIREDMAAVLVAVTVEVYQCSDYGRSLAETYLADPYSALYQISPEAGHSAEQQSESLAPADIKKISRWLILEGIVLGVASNAAYDLLKRLVESMGEAIGDALPRIESLGPTYLWPGVQLEWCYVPAGYFLMGSANNDAQAYDNERPQHRVYVPAFYSGKFPITNLQYRAFVQATNHQPPGHWPDGKFPQDKANHPTVYVSWSDAVAFCQWAARTTRKPIRLLTEAEWEKAARGTDGRRYPWGNTWQAGRCNTWEASIKDTTPVDHYPRGRSPYGVYDMSGNVWEWTSTIYQPYPYRVNDGREDMTVSDKWRVIRGCSYWSDSRWARAAYRYDGLGGWDDAGFRVGLAAPFSPASAL
jgi:formylglycine-generating enzyme required for sulfatase activity